MFFLLICSISHAVLQSTLFQIEAGNRKDQVYYRFMENKYYFPRGLCTDGYNFYIGDIHKNRILIVNGSGKFLNEIKNEEFSEIDELYYHFGHLWIKVLDNYYETASLIKYTPMGGFVFKIDPFNMKKVNKVIVDYRISKDGIYAVAQDNTCIRINPDTGEPEKIVPSFWYDKDGYYKLARKKKTWFFSIYDREKGKLKKRIKMISNNNKVMLLRKINSKIYLEKFDEGKKEYFLYHYNHQGEVDEKISRSVAVAKYFDLKFSLGYSHPQTDYIKIVQYKL